MRRILAAASAMLVAIVGLSLTTANAASLDVTTAPEVFLTQQSACGPSTANGFPIIDATASAPGTPGSYSGITLSNIPTACQDLDSPLPVDVFVHTAAGDLMSSGSGTVGSGTTTVGVGDYTGSAVTAVIVRIDGWLFPTNWTAPAPPSTGPAVVCEVLNPGGQVQTSRSCSVTVTPDGGPPGVYDGDWTATNFQFNVSWDTTPPNNNFKWRVTFDLSQPPFPGFAPQWVGVNYNPGFDPSPGYSCSELPKFSLTSRSSDTWGGNIDIGDGPAPSDFSGQSFCS